VGGLVRDVSLGDFMKGGTLDVAAEEEENSDDSDEWSSEYETDTDDGESGSEESSEGPSPPLARLRPSPSTPSLPKATPRRAQEPPSQLSKSTAVPSLANSPPLPARAPSSSVASPSPSSTGTGTRLRKLSLSLRRSRSMTFDGTRQSPSNNAEAPPVPSLPQSVAQSRSAAPFTASQSKQLPSLPPPSPPAQSATRASSAAAPVPPSRLPERTPSAAAPPHPPNARTPQKRYPTGQKLPQVPKRQKSKPPPGTLKPPELKKIAELLPIFVEMVRQITFTLAGAVHLLICQQNCTLFRRCAPRYVHGNGLRDSQPPILALERGAEFGFEYLRITANSHQIFS
jgi:hypothetical protein